MSCLAYYISPYRHLKFICSAEKYLSNFFYFVTFFNVFLARDVIYTSHAYATMSVSVCDGSKLAHYS